MFVPSSDDLFVPHSSSAAQIKASPKLQILTSLGLYIGKYTTPLDTVGSAVTFLRADVVDGSSIMYHPRSASSGQLAPVLSFVVSLHFVKPLIPAAYTV